MCGPHFAIRDCCHRVFTTGLSDHFSIRIRRSFRPVCDHGKRVLMKHAQILSGAIGFAGLFAMVWLSGCATSQDSYFAKTTSDSNVYVSERHGYITKVAIMPFRAPTELIGASVSDMLVTEMLKAGRYELVERGQMAEVLNESELALAGLSTAKAVEIGNMMGADGVIIGTVDEYGTVAQRGRSYPVVGVSIRLIDCASGKVVWSVDQADKADDSKTTLAQHGRAVVHNMVAALYRELRTAKMPRGGRKDAGGSRAPAGRSLYDEDPSEPMGM